MRLPSDFSFFITFLTLGSMDRGKNIKIFFRPVFFTNKSKFLSKLLSF